MWRGAATLLAAILAALVLAACGETTTEPTPTVNSVAIDGGDFDLQVGTSATLTATVDVTGGASTDVTWSSSDDGVATVDAGTGEVTAQGTAGQTAEITATSTADATVSDTVTVTLTAAPVVVDSVTIEGGDFDLQVGTSSTLSATVAPAGAPQGVTWSSSDDGVATVDAGTGEVTAQGTAGQTAEITATSTADTNVSGTVTVTLTDAPVTTISGLNADIVLGSQVDLTWTATNADSFDVVCDDGAGGAETTIESGLADTTAGTIVPIPASDCQTVRVYARGADNDASAELELTGVVTSELDDGPGSLRAVYAAASAGDVIGFAEDVTEVVLSEVLSSGGNEGHMVLDADVTISGPTDTPVTIRSDDSLANDTAGIPVLRTRVFDVPVGTTTQLDGLVISGGTFIASGGGVRNNGTLTISNSIIENNRAYYRGGGVVNLGTLTIENSVIQNNRAEVNDAESAAGYFCIGDVDRTCDVTDDGIYFEFGQGGSGGGVYNEAGTTTIVGSTIDGSTIDGNTAIFSGGGIYVEAGSVETTDTTISNNVASDGDVTAFTTYSFGGGVANFVDGGLTMTGGSVENNASADVGGGIANGSSSAFDLAITLNDVSITGNAAAPVGDTDDTFGGGYIHYYQSAAPGPDGHYSVTETGTTTVTGNTAGTDGPNRYFSEVVAGPALVPAHLTAPRSPSESFDRR